VILCKFTFKKECGEIGITKKIESCYLSGTNCVISFADGTYPAVDGSIHVVSGSYNYL
jgi:hypothetical protein